MTSKADILVADSDPESHTEDSTARIFGLSQSYRSGQDLFIMSASIKYELKVNPWARKRKRGSQENINTYFAAKKILEITERPESESLPHKQIDSEMPIAISSSDQRPVRQSVLTPFWDETIRPKPNQVGRARGRLQQPTARIIDFKSFNSQAIATSDENSVLPPLDPDVDLTDKPIIPSASASQGGAADIASPYVVRSDQASPLHRSPVIESRDALSATLVEGLHAGSPSAISYAQRDTPRVNGVVISPISVRHTAVNYPHSPRLSEILKQRPTEARSPITSVDLAPSLRAPSREPNNNSIGTPSLQEAVDNVEQVPSRSILNTQAELVSAQRSLAAAILFDYHSTEQAEDGAGQEAAGNLSIEPIKTHKVNSEPPLCESPKTSNAEHDVRTTTPKESETTATDMQSASLALNLIKTPTRTNRRVSKFAQFESPGDTQEPDLGFGSPLTFTPLRPSNDSYAGSSNRLERTIDNIQKYLNDSNFDAEEEARRLMEE